MMGVEKSLIVLLALSSITLIPVEGSSKRIDNDDRNLHLQNPSKVAALQGRQSNDDDNGCVTNEGRPGRCTMESACSTVKDTSSLPVCYSLFVKWVCCPTDGRPGVAQKNQPGCGVRPQVDAIVGGVDSVPNSWPWAAAIYQRHPRDPSRKAFICGGSILNEQYVISASHCVVRYEGTMKAEDFFVKVGGHDLRASGEFYDVAAVYPHENYRSWRRYNDIALFKLAKKLDFSNANVRPVCVPTEDMDKEDLTGKNATVIGWGTTSFQGDLAKNLMEVSVPIVSNEECDQAYGSMEGSTVSYPEGINHNFICAGHPDGGKDSCQGDSGGPLLIEREGRWYQIGVVSFGYKCAEKGYPGVYTRTSHFVKWLGSHTEDAKRKGSRRG